MKTKNIYSLPFDKKYFTKAVSDPRAHMNYFKNAVDFPLDENTPLIAPFDGEVIDFCADSKKGGINPKYADPKYTNYLTIKHKLGEYSQYVHLKHKGVLVNRGEKVKCGQPIALSGNTGLSTQPHLHFMVFKLAKNDAGFESLEIKFKTKIKIDRNTPKIPDKFKKLIEKVKKISK